jgi:DNA-binding GntR family transcriptional regulator
VSPPGRRHPAAGRLRDLAGNQQLVEVVRSLRSRSRLEGLRDSDSSRFILQNAREHLELVSLLADGRVTAVGDLFRRHLSGITAGWPAS